MTRPSRHTEKDLIEAAIKLLPKTGCSHLSLRVVASKAKVNIGMFHYHFKNKDDFLKQVLQEVYERFFSEFKIEADQHKSDFENLRAILFFIAKFVRGNKDLLKSLVKDAINGEKAVIEMFSKNAIRHIGIIFHLVYSCQKAGLLKLLPLLSVLPMLLGGINFSVLLQDFFERALSEIPSELKNA